MGWRVFYSAAPVRAPFPKLPTLADRDIRTALLVDNADLAHSFPNLTDDIQRKPMFSSYVIWRHVPVSILAAAIYVGGHVTFFHCIGNLSQNDEVVPGFGTRG
jgi:hypothetical protein